MRVVIAPDSFKGSLSAAEVGEAIQRGVKRVEPEAETVLLPLSDGGEGLVESLVEASGGTYHEFQVTGPLGAPVWAKLGLLGDGQTGVIEMAQASGLTLVPPDKRNPLVTTTYGTGELIGRALDLGCNHLVIGIGGSATNDGGMGMAQALGVRFLDGEGKELGSGGGELARLASIDVSGLDPRLAAVTIEVACDVDNPLTGPTGASHIYGPQKGATPEMVAQLDAALGNYAEVIRKDLGRDVETVPGAGAAGGLGAGLMALLGGKLVSGIQLVLKVLRFEEQVQGADLVFTGEGKFDAQSAFGKVPVGVGRICRGLGVPVVVLAGTVTLDSDVLHGEGITASFSVLNQPLSLEEAMAQTAELVEFQAAQVMRLWLHR
ncbi:MAG TPA: glycerate kinase [Firmicutes bacterium]|nr:MAG: glycerate kinase [Peptococcaceae bacterium 1109]HHT73630.1 glycerate kinase [Bacillota bacterium]